MVPPLQHTRTQAHGRKQASGGAFKRAVAYLCSLGYVECREDTSMVSERVFEGLVTMERLCDEQAALRPLEVKASQQNTARKGNTTFMAQAQVIACIKYLSGPLLAVESAAITDRTGFDLTSCYPTRL